MKKINKTKVCNRCKKLKDIYKSFKSKAIERISGIQQWIHPWCNACRLEVKIKWGINWIGGTKSARQKQNKKENTNTVSSISQRRSNKKVHIQRIERTVSEPDDGQHKPTKNTLRRRADLVRNTSRSGHVIETLKKTKDYKGTIQNVKTTSTRTSNT